MTLKQFKNTYEDHINLLFDFIDSEVESKGLREEDCQRLLLINRLLALEQAFNGVEKHDLKITGCRQASH